MDTQEEGIGDLGKRLWEAQGQGVLGGETGGAEYHPALGYPGWP